jgi:4-oxalocrotonate tautomerase
MPHVIVKLWPGKSERQKARLSEAIVNDVMNVLNYGEESVSVAFEEVKPEDWAEKTNPTSRASGTSFTRSRAMIQPICRRS